MKSLFEKEEKETAINQLKVDLISRFYPFSNSEILNYKGVLNLDRYHLMANELIQWDVHLIDSLQDKLDWSAIYKLKNFNFDLKFFKRFESLIDFSSIHLSRNVVWSERLIQLYGDKLDWSKWLIIRESLSTINNLRRFKDKLDWAIVSKSINLDFTDELINEFKDNWDWKKLSANPCLPASDEFLKKYENKLAFDEFSKNPASLPLIYKDPTNLNWNWERIIINQGIIYNEESFNLIYPYYKRYFDDKHDANPEMKGMSFLYFLHRLFISYQGDLSYFLNDRFIKILPWRFMSKYCNTKFDLDFIVKYSDKFDFKETQLIYSIRDNITVEFVEKNHHLFDKSRYPFYYLPLTINLVQNSLSEINWNNLSSCEKLNWNWQFIEDNLYNFNSYKLSENRGIYEELIFKPLSKKDVLEILELQIR